MIFWNQFEKINCHSWSYQTLWKTLHLEASSQRWITTRTYSIAFVPPPGQYTGGGTILGCFTSWSIEDAATKLHNWTVMVSISWYGTHIKHYEKHCNWKRSAKGELRPGHIQSYLFPHMVCTQMEETTKQLNCASVKFMIWKSYQESCKTL